MVKKKKSAKTPKREPLFFIRPSEDQTIDEIADAIVALMQPPIEAAPQPRTKKRARRSRKT